MDGISTLMGQDGDYLIWRDIASSIPDVWKVLVTQETVQITDLNRKCGIEYDGISISINMMMQKEVKNVLKWRRHNNCNLPNLMSKAKYDEMFTGISDEMLTNVYILAKNVSIDHKIIEMQFLDFTQNFWDK